MENLGINVLYSKYEELKEKVGAEKLLECLVQQMSSNTLQDLLEQAFIDFDEYDEDLNPGD